MTDHAKPSGRVLVIAGSDSGAGAGIQADIKTVMALGGYATTAVTALTAQNTECVIGVQAVPPAFVADQIRVVVRDIGADCWKSGMLCDDAVVEAVAETYDDVGAGVPLVVDPVMFAKGGHSLLDAGALDVLKQILIPRAAMVTPNVPEAELLADTPVRSQDDMARVAEQILEFGCQGGALEGWPPARSHRQRSVVYCRRRRGLRGRAHTDKPDPRHGLHTRVGNCHRLGTRACRHRRRDTRPRLSSRGYPVRQDAGSWSWPVESRAHHRAV